MLKGFDTWRSTRGVLIAAAASAAMLVAGCADEQPAPPAASADTNVVHAAYDSGAQAPGQSRVAMWFPTGNRNSSDLMVEQIGSAQVRVGQPYTYQIRVTNMVDQPLTGIVIRERIPESFRLTSPAAQDNDHRAHFDLGDLGPHQTKTFEVTGTASQQGTLDTCLSAQYNPPMLCSHLTVVAPAIRAVVEGPSQADVCQDLTYRFTVANTGTGTAHGVVLQEALPNGLATTDGQQSFSANLGDLAGGQSKEVTATLHASEAGRFTTYAVARSDAGDARTGAVVTQVLAPRLAVTLTGPKDAYLGQQVAYQVAVTNRGDAPAVAARVRLGATPGDVQFVSETGQNPNTGKLASEQQGGGETLGDLAPNESRSLTITFQSVEKGQIAVNATATARCAQDVTTYANTNITAVTASSLIVTHNIDPVLVGNNVTYTLIVENKGDVADHDIHVTARLPESEHFVSANGATQGTVEGREINFAPVATLEPKQRLSWEVTGKAFQPGEVDFRGSLTSQGTPKAAEKIEPTKLIASESGTQTHTSEAPASPSTDHPAPPADQLQK